MARQLKVFSGSVRYNGKHMHCILATTTKKKACEILDVSNKELTDFWYCWEKGHGDKNAIDQALAQPETQLYCYDKDYYKRDVIYKKMEEIND